MSRMWKINVATVFTTHATMLGREVTQDMNAKGVAQYILYILHMQMKALEPFNKMSI
jgi:hypothetical protein